MSWKDVRPEARLWTGDALDGLQTLPDASVQCCVTSPPYYGLRSYLPQGHADKALEVGAEETPDAYVARLVEVFREVRRVLRDDGTCFVNLGDSYCSTDKWGGGKSGNTGKHTVADSGDVPSWDARRQKRPHIDGIKPKDLIGIPWMVAFALRADGWYLRQDILWSKKNCMPESVTDRCTKSHEYVFLLAKRERYFFDAVAIQEVAVCDRKRGPVLHGDLVSTNGNAGLSRRDLSDTRNRRSVWTLSTENCAEAHFAVMPSALADLCIRAGCPVGGTVIDPFTGSGTTGIVALRQDKRFVGCELNAEYAKMAARRIAAVEIQLALL
jgi:DNA modification methylase